MGGKNKLAEAQSKASAIAQQTAMKQAKAARAANRVAVRTAQQDRRVGTRQNAALIAAERDSAAALAALDQGNVQTEFIEDDEMMRRQGGRKGAYSFGRPMSTMLGGSDTRLG